MPNMNLEMLAFALPLGARIVAAFFSVVAMFVFALIATYQFWVPWLLKTMADNNFLITTVEEGTAKAFLRYEKFNRVAMCWKDYHLTPDWDVVSNSEKDSHWADDHWLDAILPGSLRWLGLPFANSIYEYHFQWTSLRQGVLGSGGAMPKDVDAIVKQEDLTDLIDSRDRWIDYVLLKVDIYCIAFKSIEDVEMIPLSCIALLTARVTNPYKALFGPQQWLEQTTNFLRGYIKDYIGKNKFSDLTKATSKSQADAILESDSPETGVKIRDYIRDRWGVEIHHLNLVNINPGGKRGEAYETAAATMYVKHQEAVGIKEIADAEAYRDTTVAEAVTKAGPNGLTVRALEALEKMGESGNTIVIGGENPVSMLLNTANAKQTGGQGGKK